MTHPKFQFPRRNLWDRRSSGAPVFCFWRLSFVYSLFFSRRTVISHGLEIASDTLCDSVTNGHAKVASSWSLPCCPWEEIACTGVSHCVSKTLVSPEISITLVRDLDKANHTDLWPKFIGDSQPMKRKVANFWVNELCRNRGGCPVAVSRGLTHFVWILVCCFRLPSLWIKQNKRQRSSGWKTAKVTLYIIIGMMRDEHHFHVLLCAWRGDKGVDWIAASFTSCSRTRYTWTHHKTPYLARTRFFSMLVCCRCIPQSPCDRLFKKCS